MATTQARSSGRRGAGGAAAPARAEGQFREAAEEANAQSQLEVRLPGVGQLRLPGAPQLAFTGGLAVLAVLEVLEWPVAMAIAVGHALANSQRSATVREFGQALEDA